MRDSRHHPSDRPTCGAPTDRWRSAAARRSESSGRADAHHAGDQTELFDNVADARHVTRRHGSLPHSGELRWQVQRNADLATAAHSSFTGARTLRLSSLSSAQLRLCLANCRCRNLRRKRAGCRRYLSLSLHHRHCSRGTGRTSAVRPCTEHAHHVRRQAMEAIATSCMHGNSSRLCSGSNVNVPTTLRLQEWLSAGGTADRETPHEHRQRLESTLQPSAGTITGWRETTMTPTCSGSADEDVRSCRLTHWLG